MAGNIPMGSMSTEVGNINAFNDDNEEIMTPNDGLHFGKVGYEKLAEIVYNEIKDLL